MDDTLISLSLSVSPVVDDDQRQASVTEKMGERQGEKSILLSLSLYRPR